MTDGAVPKPWDPKDKVRCVVLCAGRGSRLNPITADMPKVLAEVNGKPVIHYVIDFWKQFTDDFIFIVGYKKDAVIDYISRETVSAEFIEQKEQRGIAHAVLHSEKLVHDKFIVVLGDCVCNGGFLFPGDMDQGVGVWTTDNEEAIRQSYSVELQDGLIKRVAEKPGTVINNLCGMGFYFFRKKVFDYIRVTMPSSLRNEVEITDVIQKMIEAGEPVSPVWFNGGYINVTFPEDIDRAGNMVPGLRE